MELDRQQLEAACREVASCTLWQTKNPRDIDDIIDKDQIERTVAGYMANATEQADYVTELGGDPNLVTRAVRYLAHEHAIPPMKDDVFWFENALEILVQLIHPNAASNPSSSTFLKDLEDGYSPAQDGSPVTAMAHPRAPCRAHWRE